MSKAPASDSHDLFDEVRHPDRLADLPDDNPDDDSLDLEAYLDLEESPEITRLMQAMRAGEPQAPAAPAAAARGAPLDEPRPPAGRTAAGAAGALARTATRHSPEADAARTPSPAPEEGEPARREPRRLDLAAVAGALGTVSVQARQLVVACPRCEGRASIVVYADRFKCFGCGATGDERALAAHLTGWDSRRVGAWLEAAASRSEIDDTEVRRPWRLSFFAR